MQCPLCGGPLHVEDENRFVCERGHALAAAELQVAATQRATHALWMAIAALESEAAALRTVAGIRGDDRSGELADQAEKDAQLLRDITRTHIPPGQDAQEAS
jgi:hypothetical protein